MNSPKREVVCCKMFVAAILIFSNCLCGFALSTIGLVETQPLSHGHASQTQVTQMRIAFDLADITAAIELPSVTVHLEGFKSVENDEVDMAEAETSQLRWASIGHPRFIKTKDPHNAKDVKFFHSSDKGFTTYVQMMTEEQRAALATAAKNKYQVDIPDRQVVHLILSKFYCNMLLYDEAGSRYLIRGNVSDFRHFPLRMDFDIPLGKIERILFSKFIEDSEGDVRFECQVESGGGKLIKSNTLSISYEQSQQIGLEGKLFGPAGGDGPDEIYVTRYQMFELAHEMYSTLNIIDEYQMQETQFSDAFVSDFVSQLATSQFVQIPIDTVLTSISKYSLDIDADLRPDIIRKDIGSFLYVSRSDEKSKIVFDEKSYNEWADSYKFSTRTKGGVPGIFGASFNAAIDISNRATTDHQTLDEQMRELNTLSLNEAQWEIEDEKIVPKSLNVACIMRFKMNTSLTFERIRIQKFNAPFERNFNLCASRSSQLLCQDTSTPKDEDDDGGRKGTSRSVRRPQLQQRNRLGRNFSNREKVIVPLKENRALGRPTTQSSTYASIYEASKAVDGNYHDNDHRVAPLSCSVTGDGAGGPNWWRVELDRLYRVQRVTVTNRKDCCADRLDYFIVGVTNSKAEPVRGIYPLCGQYHSKVAYGATATVHCNPDTSVGSYVIIQQPINGPGYLTLCEVEIYAEAVGNLIVPLKENLALGRPTTQSSTFASSSTCTASKAVDGNYDYDLTVAPFSCSITGDVTGGPNWWRVELDRPYRVRRVTATNRKDCCADRLDYFIVGVTNSKADPVRGTYPLCGQYQSTVALGATVEVHCNPDTSVGQYVIIQQPINGAGYLTLCEVEVYAEAV